MPGSNPNSTYEGNFGTETPVTKPVIKPKTSPFYQERDFRTTKMSEMYGDNPTRRDQRRFNRYMKSDQGQADELAFVQAESKKYLDSFDAYANNALQKIRNANKELALKPKVVTSPASTITTPPVNSPTNDNPGSGNGVGSFNTSFWDGKAKEGGFSDSAAVKHWQQEHGSKYGIVADGKFGPKTKAAYEQFKRDYQPIKEDQLNSDDVKVSQPISMNLEEYAKKNGLFHVQSNSMPISIFNGKKYLRHDPLGIGDFWVGEDGKIYNADWGGDLGSEVTTDQLGLEGSDRYNNYQKVLNAINAFKGIKRNKQGGIMNKINYFQQGGATPQQDIQQQVVALVQAAMQGDQKATQTVNQIMEAAKSGDQQAVQIAQMIQQVAQKMQGQVTSAKYGSKLAYLQSLKCGGKSKKKEKGGKVCPECEKAKKVEMKACGGKQAKKRYFGGLI